ncbi:MAG: DUF2934 domain-containing protein [Chlorobium sp.]|nr:MAG: DUF2934 domain-containing protein [Chlorobium sp.]
MAKSTTEKEDKKKNPVKKSKKTKGVQTQEMREEQVRIAAYYRWENRGKTHGSDSEDWFEAEDSLSD